MSLKSFKPVTPSNRYKVWPSFDEITTSTPEKSLCRPLKKSGGRNNNGRITTRHIGGGHKRKYRLVDFKRNKFDVPATVLTIEYDPNRTCRLHSGSHGVAGGHEGGKRPEGCSQGRQCHALEERSSGYFRSQH